MKSNFDILVSRLVEEFLKKQLEYDKNLRNEIMWLKEVILIEIVDFDNFFSQVELESIEE